MASRIRKAAIALGAAALVAGSTATTSSSAEAATKPYTFKNCTALHKKFPHGVGMPDARDKTSGKPVTTFHRSKAWYQKNKKSDRDKDGIACEKR